MGLTDGQIAGLGSLVMAMVTIVVALIGKRPSADAQAANRVQAAKDDRQAQADRERELAEENDKLRDRMETIIADRDKRIAEMAVQIDEWRNKYWTEHEGIVTLRTENVQAVGIRDQAERDRVISAADIQKLTNQNNDYRRQIRELQAELQGYYLKERGLPPPINGSNGHSGDTGPQGHVERDK